MELKERMKTLLEKLNTGIYEKEEIMALALLSSIAGESIFLLGPPGVAKSLIARRLKYAYKDAKVFEYLMSRFSTPDEIFGPVSISKLKEDKYERITDNYLPEADVVFLDEIWKAGPSIQNALLTVVNEKIFRNGEKEIDVPMKALLSASNELPEKNQGLEALWDRFLVRLIVKGIKDEKKFNDMIAMPSAVFDEKVDGSITDDEYKEWSTKIEQIDIPENIFNVIQVIREKIELHNQNEENAEKQIYISDRRWRKIVRLMRTSAFLNCREEVDLMDCFLIKHCIWNEAEQQDTVWQFVSETIEKYGYIKDIDFNNIRDELVKFEIEIDEETKSEKDARKPVLFEKDGYYELTNSPSQNNNYIQKDDFEQLTDEDQRKYAYYWQGSYFNKNGYFQARKGKDKFNISLDGTDYQLKTEIQGDKWQITMKPRPDVEIMWDKERVDVFLQYTGNLRNRIEQDYKKDLEHLCTNLFVEDPKYTKIIESHITATYKKIEKIELEIKEIQNSYKKLRNEEVILDD